jgi:hypothetical protein
MEDSREIKSKFNVGNKIIGYAKGVHGFKGTIMNIISHGSSYKYEVKWDNGGNTVVEKNSVKLHENLTQNSKLSPSRHDISGANTIQDDDSSSEESSNEDSDEDSVESDENE